MKKWYRVTERFSPLCGADVYGEQATDIGGRPVGLLAIEKIRRFDVFAGDRPFQMITPNDERNLGLFIKEDHLEESLIQDEIVEMTSRGSPYGKCLDEFSLERKFIDGVTIHVVIYENLKQVALLNDGKKVLSTNALLFRGVDKLMDAFVDNASLDELILLMKEIE